MRVFVCVCVCVCACACACVCMCVLCVCIQFAYSDRANWNCCVTSLVESLFKLIPTLYLLQQFLVELFSFLLRW